MDDLNIQIKLARKRIRKALAVKWAAAGLTVGLLCASIAIAFGGRIWPQIWEYSSILVALVFASVGILAGALPALFHRISDFKVARILETHSDLKDRVSSAIWAAESNQPNTEALVADASASLDHVELTETIPLSKPAYFKLPAASFAILMIAILLPVFSVMNSPAKRAASMEVKKQGVELRKVAAKIAKAPQADKELREQLAAKLDKLGKQLQSGRVSSEQARVKMNKLNDEMSKQSELIAKKNNLDNAWMVPQKFEQFKGEMASGTMTKMAKDAESMKASSALNKNMNGIPGLNTSGMPKMAMKPGQNGKPGAAIPPELAKRLAELYGMKDFQEAAKLLEELQKKLGLKPSASQQMAMAADLEALSKALSEAQMKELAKQLLEAAKALQAMDPEEARKLLSKAAGECKKMGLGIGMMQCLGMGQGACQRPSGGYNQYSSTDQEMRDQKGIGNPADGGRRPGGSRMDREWTKLYAGRRTTVKTKSMKAPSQIGKNGQMMEIDVEGAPDPNAKSGVPYYEVYPQYKDAAEKAMSRDEVPLTDKKKVKDYFNALQ